MSKIIPKDAGGEVRTWQAPKVRGKHVVGGRGINDEDATLVTAQRIEDIERQAHDDGFQRGLKEGLEAGRAQIDQQLAAIDRVMQQLSTPLEALDETVEESLLELVLAVSRQVIRRELKTDPGQIVATVREALAALPVAQRDVVLKLHPDDAALVRETMGAEVDATWKVQEDPSLTRGGCYVVSDTSRVDATVEHRLNAIAANLLGGEREDDERD